MSIRQEKFAAMLQNELGQLFTRHRSEMFNNAFVTVSNVTVSPDLGHAKVYLSLLQVVDKYEMMNIINLQSALIRKLLAEKIRKQVRVIPDLQFLLDDSLEYVFKMEKVFEELKKKENKN
jgi:ribosome-binding factor A